MDLPGGLTARPATKADLDGVFAVARAYDIEMLGEPDLEKVDIETFWNTPTFRLETDTMTVVDGVRVVAHGEIQRGKYLDICVHPESDGHAIRSALSEWGEDRLREIGATHAKQSSLDTDRVALQVLAQRGYHQEWTSWALALPGDVEIPHRDLPEGYQLRTYLPGVEERTVYDVIQTAFDVWPDRVRTPYEDWHALVFEREGFGPDNMLVVTHQDRIVGACYVVDGENTGWVNSLAIDSAHRHRGLAQALLETAFTGTRSRGLERAELGTSSYSGALDLYLGLGMHVTQTYEEWSLAL